MKVMKLWLPAALPVIVVPVAMAVAGEELYAWRLVWLIPAGLAVLLAVAWGASKLTP